MAEDEVNRRLRQAGLRAYRSVLLASAGVLVLVMFLGLAYLVLRGRMSDGPLILFAGVILGYILRLVHDWI